MLCAGLSKRAMLISISITVGIPTLETSDLRLLNPSQLALNGSLTSRRSTGPSPLLTLMDSGPFPTNNKKSRFVTFFCHESRIFHVKIHNQKFVNNDANLSSVFLCKPNHDGDTLMWLDTPDQGAM